MKTKRKPQLCKTCGGATKYGNLFCTVDCVKKHDEKRDAHIEALKAAGFEQRHNIFTKDGVSDTLERTLHVGIDEAIRQHGHVRIG